MKALDPVCGMEVDTEHATFQSEHGGQTYYFCSPGCKKAFDKNPQRYMQGEGHSSHEHHGHH